MGYMRHHAIVVTSWDQALIERAHEKAVSIMGELVSPLLPKVIGGHRSFFVAPDGSKEGWDDSNIGDSNRAAFLEWADAQRYEDGGSMFDWVEVQYGDDNLQARICRHSDEHTDTEGMSTP